jgi:hypothetical protein
MGDWGTGQGGDPRRVASQAVRKKTMMIEKGKDMICWVFTLSHLVAKHTVQIV